MLDTRDDARLLLGIALPLILMAGCGCERPKAIPRHAKENAMSNPLIIERIVSPPFMENTFVIGDLPSKEALVLDAGGNLPQVEAALARHGLTAVLLLSTHAHVDHVAGVAEAKRRLGAPFALHQDDRELLQALPRQAALFGIPTVETPTVDRWLAGGEELTLGTRRFKVIHTPGHSQGGCSLYFEADGVLFTGDTLFQRSIGRTDLPGGDHRQLVDSIRDRLFGLGDAVLVYPGHGERSTLGEERRENPYVAD